MPGSIPDAWFFGPAVSPTVNSIAIQTGWKNNVQIDARARARLVPGQTTGTWDSRFIKSDPGTKTVNWVAQWTTPVKFEKYAANPIYGPKNSSGWDDWTNGVSIIPYDNNTRYRMYFCSRKNGIGFAEGLVSAPTSFKEHPSSPVLKGRPDNWEGGTINQPRVIKLTETHWRMYFTGWGHPTTASRWSFGIADSHDSGVTWKRLQDDPIMLPDPTPSPDDAGTFVPSFLRFGDTWLMYYTAIKIAPNGRQHIHMCLAKSTDGVNWEKYPGNPVLGDSFVDGAQRSVTSRVCLRYDEGVFKMWYSFGKPLYRICYAESVDGIHWERYEPSPVLDTSPEKAWDDDIVEYPEVQFVDNIWRLWFCGNGYGSVGYASAKPTAGVTMQFRTGVSAQPDATWGEWQSVTQGQQVQSLGHVQLRATITQSDLTQPSPTLTSASVLPA